MSFLRVLVNLFHFNRTNWKAVTLCIIAALVFWFFNALNKDYSTNLRFAVDFDYDQEKYIPVNPLPQDVFMNVSGNGWDLFRKSLGVNMPEMNISLERPAEVKKIVGSTLPALLAGQLGNLHINHMVTDTLYLSVDQRHTKKVKLTVDADKITYADGFARLSPIVVLPDSIEIEGPRTLVNELSDSLILDVNETEIRRDYREKVTVTVLRNELLTPNPREVEVLFEIVEWQKVYKNIKLEIENSPSSAKIDMIKDSVACWVQIPKSEAENFSQVMNGQMAVLNLSNLKRGAHKILPRVVGLPRYARLLHIDSIAIKLY